MLNGWLPIGQPQQITAIWKYFLIYSLNNISSIYPDIQNSKALIQEHQPALRNSTINIPATARGSQIPRVCDNTIAELWGSSHLCMIYPTLPIIVDKIPPGTSVTSEITFLCLICSKVFYFKGRPIIIISSSNNTIKKIFNNIKNHQILIDVI